MKHIFHAAVATVAFGMAASVWTPALAGDFCPMGGVLIRVDVDQEKLVEWLDDERREFIQEEEDAWPILTVSDASDRVGLRFDGDGVFFGIADDRDREADERRVRKAFGEDLRFLKEAVKKEMKSLWRGEVVGISGGDVQALSDAAGLGILSRDGSDWVLETKDCEGMTLNLDEID